MDLTDLDALEANLGREAMLALRDGLLRRLPPEPSHSSVRKLSNVERQAEAAKARFDAVHVAPTSGPVFDAIKKAGVRDRLQRARMSKHKGRARFYPQPDPDGEGWRVMDRLTGAVAYFALDSAPRPANLCGLPSRRKTMDVVRSLEAYFKGLGLPCDAEPALTRPAAMAATIIPDDLWERVAAIIPEASRGRRGPARDVDARSALAGIIHALRNRLAWRDIPAEIGCSGVTCATRLRDWQSNGSWPQIETLLLQHIPGATLMGWDRLIVDPITTVPTCRRLLARIDRFIEDAGISDRRFGVLALNRETLMHRLRQETTLRRSTYDRIARYLDDAEPANSHARQHIARRPSGPNALITGCEKEALLARIECHLSATKTPASNFGKQAFNNPGFVRHLRMGRGVTEKVRDRILQYITSFNEAPSTSRKLS